GRRLGRSAVDETELRARSGRLEVDLDPARSRRDVLVALPAPGEHDAPVRDDLDVLPGRDVLAVGEVDPERAARTRLQLGEASLPLHVLDRIGQEPKDGLRARGDGDDFLDDVRVDGHACSSLLMRGWTASMTFAATARPCSSLSLFALRRGLQRPEALVPESVQVRAELGDRLGPRPVEALGPVPALGHEACLLHDAQVLRDRGAGDVEAARDLADRKLAGG